jgi:hypothetical protein
MITSTIILHDGSVYGLGNGKVVAEIDKDTGEILNQDDKKSSFSWVGDVDDIGPVDYFSLSFRLNDKIYAIAYLDDYSTDVLVELDLENLTMRYVASVYDSIQSIFITSTEVELGEEIGLGLPEDYGDDVEYLSWYWYEDRESEEDPEIVRFFLEKSLFPVVPTTSNMQLEYGTGDTDERTWSNVAISAVTEEAYEETSLTWYKFNCLRPTEDSYILRIGYTDSDYKMYIGED